MKLPTKITESNIKFMNSYLKNPLNTLGIYKMKYGDIFRVKFKNIESYYITHPKYLEYIALTNQDNYQKHPAFIKVMEPFIGKNSLIISNNSKQWQQDRITCKKLMDVDIYFEEYAKQIVTHCQEVLDTWDHTLKKPTLINLEKIIDKLVFKVANNTIFYDLGADEELLLKKIRTTFSNINRRSSSLLGLQWVFPTPTRREHLQSMKFCDDYSRELIIRRINSQKDIDDTLGHLLRTYPNPLNDPQQMRLLQDHLVFLVVVGYITTASSLITALTLFSLYPDVSHQIAEEAQHVFGNNLPTYKDLEKLTYTQAAYKEVLRLYPPLVTLLRQAINEDEVHGYYVAPNTCFNLNLFHIHRHPEFWDNPMGFDPKRFLDNPWGQDYQYAYQPFGVGKRSCLGRNFAFMEACLLIAMILRKYQLQLPGNIEPTYKYISSILIRMNTPLAWLKDR